MSVVRETVERVTGSKKLVHLAWLAVLLLVGTGHVVAAGGGTSGP